ncbi:M23 family metallopeptidase [Bacillus sp. 2205SS5-2]|uniref:M23 family metallopeptidase n=1 Tax=Bacillus sp. 2205SS5-2 TaxID=3109031 RepID=UPI00300750B2
MKKALYLIVLLFLLSSLQPYSVNGEELSAADHYRLRMELYSKFETTTQIPWYYLAAIDQYERSWRFSRRDIPNPEGIISIYIPKEKWAGELNPNLDDQNPASISFFNGIGLDGDLDGKADSFNNEDILMTISQHILAFGVDEDNFKIGLWNYYKRDKTVGIIMGKAKIYQTYGTIKLEDKAFPLPQNFNYSYRNTWGDARGWGGRRIHEGTDIFADYGVPVRSTCYGIIEMKGWNQYGGWRLGIRDINNTYHYFAHLNGFAKDLSVGQAVKPGQLIGGVGSTGYGPPGTSGKFPPHLHYGMYKDNGHTEWSFDSYPHLRLWERHDRQKR